MLPILLIASFLGFVGYKLGKGHDRKIPPIAFGAMPSAMSGARRQLTNVPGGPSPTPYLDFVVRVVNSGKVPNQNIVDAAYAEAAAMGDYATMQTLQALVVQWTQQAIMAQQAQAQPAPQEQVLTGAEEMAPNMETGDLGDYESANPTQAPKASPVAPVVPAFAPNTSPIDGVPVDEWCQLVQALKTRNADYRSDDYLGAWEHNRRRLRQLGIDDATVATEDGQYNALVADLTDHHKKCGKLVEDHCGDVVDVNGTPTPVTLSGVLGLLKAAGPRGAEGWLKNPEDRKAFPQTTAAFVRCNGHF